MRKKSYFMYLTLVTTLIIFLIICCGRRKTEKEIRAEGVVPTINLLTTTEEYDPVRYKAAYKIAEWWSELGLDINVFPLEFNLLTEKIRDRDLDQIDWQAFIYGWSGRIERADPDMFIYSISHSSQARIGGNNTYKYKNAEYDALAESQRRIADPEIRQIVVNAAQEKLYEDIPFVSLYYRYVLSAYQSEYWQNITAMPGEGLFHEWIPFHAIPTEKNLALYSAETENNKPWLVVAVNQKPGSLNPLTATTVWEWKVLRLFYDKLVRVNQNFRPEPWAAEEIRHISDTVIEVVLRSNMTFHDGMPVRSEDIKFTYDYMMYNDISYFTAFLTPIKSIEITDEGYIRFHLKEPYAPFVPLTLAQIPILPEHLWADRKPEDDLSAPMVGSGPLKFESWESDKEIILSVNSSHFYTNNLQIAGIKHRLYPGLDEILDSMIEGKVSLIDAHLNPESVSRINDIPEINLITVPDIGFHFLGFNCSAPPFMDKKLRKAAAKAIDLDYIVDNLLLSHGDKGGPGQPISTGNPFWRNADLPELSFDLDKARQILTEAGFTWDNQGRLNYPD